MKKATKESKPSKIKGDVPPTPPAAAKVRGDGAGVVKYDTAQKPTRAVALDGVIMHHKPALERASVMLL